jgi:hypothetical protein
VTYGRSAVARAAGLDTGGSALLDAYDTLAADPRIQQFVKIILKHNFG